MLPAQWCLDCEGWRKSRLQIIRTNNYCEVKWSVHHRRQTSEEEIQSCLPWTSWCIIRLEELDFELAFVNTQFFIVTLSNSIFFDKFPPENLQRIFKYLRIILTRLAAWPSSCLFIFNSPSDWNYQKADSTAKNSVKNWMTWSSLVEKELWRLNSVVCRY